MGCDGLMGDVSGSLRGDECGSRGHRNQRGMNWNELLRRGPGDSPGRSEAIARAELAGALRKRLAKREEEDDEGRMTPSFFVRLRNRNDNGIIFLLSSSSNDPI